MASFANLLNGLYWLLVLLLVSWWLAVIAFVGYLVASILVGCCGGVCLRVVADFLLKGVQFPGACAKNMRNMARYDAVGI